MTTVSVIIPAYNAAGFVQRAIDSALAQTVPPLEILVVDDGSADDTAKVVAEYPAPVRLLCKPNGGPASARNLGAGQARGDWLAMLDADDHWAPQKLERQLELATAPDIGLIHGPSTRHPNIPAELSFEDLWAQNWITNSSVLIRRTAFQELGGFNEDRRLISVEDYNLWLRIRAAGWRILSCRHPAALTYYSTGIGLSSNMQRFFDACMYNYELIGREMRLPAKMLQEKRLQVYETTGVSALHERRMRLARQMYLRAFAQRPTLPRAIRLAAAHLPSPVLNVRRRLLEAADRITSSGGAPQAACDTTVFPRGPVQAVDFPDGPPVLLVVIDAEEEFDWEVLPSSSRNVSSMKAQELAQRLYARYQLVPTYAVDYPVASQPDGYLPLLPFLQDGSCEVGAQLHPWTNPPIEEELTERNTFPGHLPEALEFEKLRVLTEVIRRNFARQPILYRAGRYGAGPHTANTLIRLGYQVDCSVLPLYDLSGKLGPDYSRCPTTPYWCDPDNRLLEIPVTAGMTGLLARTAPGLHPLAFTKSGESVGMPGLLSNLHLLDRIRLSPEGNSLEEAKRLTRTMFQRDGRRLFVLSYHSPSLVAGNTPYVRTESELRQFLHWIEAYLDFFFGEMGGRASTPGAVYRWAKQSRSPMPEALAEATLA